jgi:F0F1-type ATP synthase beta subunit
VCELLWVKEVFVIYKVANDVVKITDKISQNADVCTKLLPTDVKVGLVSKGKLLNVLGSLIDIVAHKRSMGSKSAPSASRSAPRCIHMFLSARWYRCSLQVTAAISTSSGSSAQRRESRYNQV